MSHLDSLRHKEHTLKDFPLVKKLDENMRNIPHLAEYLKTRPITTI